MSIKKYGIYLSYQPTVDLRTQGLGRHLAEFLKAAQERKDICFVIACPSWMKSSLVELFEDAGIQQDGFEIIAPRKKPLLLILYEHYVMFRKRLKRNNLSKDYYHSFEPAVSKVRFWVEGVMVSTRSKTLMGIFSLLIISPFLVLFGIDILVWIASRILFIFNRFFIQKLTISFKLLDWIKKFTTNPKDSSKILELFKVMRKYEAELINNLINARSDIKAWYCPTAFWPDFNRIKIPRLMCVPDVVLTDFPISYAHAGTDRMLDSFREVEKSIEGGEYFVTYSEDVKLRTLVQRYNIDPKKTFVVPHGANTLDKLIKSSCPASANNVVLTSFCSWLLEFAVSKSPHSINRNYFLEGSSIKYIFYASQFRPNKNISSLIKAYNYLLKRKYIPHKLILTGDPRAIGVHEIIKAHNLENDVLCLQGLSMQQLAACYKLADLAVNPSLSEGGCPFTFTEALSVNTPVVMARIPVTLEVIKDPDLDKEMLFDPYDWKDMADRIEWGLQNREVLLAKQQLVYNVLKERTWRTVVDEYIDILDYISPKDLDKITLKDAA